MPRPSEQAAATFRDTAQRRAVEAKHRLSCLSSRPARDRFDAAVVCALLSAECALKAALLHGHGYTSIDDSTDDPKAPCFAGRSGTFSQERMQWVSVDVSMKTGTRAVSRIFNR